MRLGFAAVLLSLATLPALADRALADDVSDRLQAAIAANDAGDLKTAGAELAAATQAMAAKKSALLNAALPAAPQGWTMTVNEEYTQSLSMAGGGTGTEARYDGPDGSYVNVTYVMESPLMAMMMGMFGNAQTLAMLGKTVEIGGATYLDQDNSLVTVVDNRIMITLNGAETATLLPFAQAIDHAGLAKFDLPQ